jgi:hypothetical protein
MTRLAAAIVVLCVLVAIYTFIYQPSNDRAWTPDQQVLTTAKFDGELIHIFNVRNNTYRTMNDYDVQHYNATYNLSELERAWFLVEPFSSKGAAHTLVTFEFKGEKFLAVSVEIRKEQGEQFSAVKGLFRQYELMYVVADEEDVIKLRSNYRKDTVYLYPVNTTKVRAQKMLVSMLSEANNLARQPQFYNTIVNTCTTSIVRHVNQIAPNRISFDWRILLPRNADEYAFEMGLLDVNAASIEEARTEHKINDLAMAESETPFSVRIRDADARI